VSWRLGCFFSTPFAGTNIYCCFAVCLGTTVGKMIYRQDWEIPAQTWGFTAISPYSFHASAAGLKQRPEGAESYSLADESVQNATEQHASAVEVSSKALLGVDKGLLHLGTDNVPKSIWKYCPFVMFVGVIISLLAKLLLAQPCAKFSTDALRSIMKAQLEVIIPSRTPQKKNSSDLLAMDCYLIS
jgi:hypothetical protein